MKKQIKEIEVNDPVTVKAKSKKRISLEMEFARKFKELDLEEELDEKFKDTGIVPRVYHDMIVFDLKTKSELKKVISILKPTNTEHVIEHGNKWYEPQTPFRVGIENPATPKHITPFCLKVSYEYNEYKVRIKVLLSEYMDFVVEDLRTPTDSEYVHFIGISATTIRNMKIKCYKFKTPNHVGWYGGDKTLIDEDIINEIINS